VSHSSDYAGPAKKNIKKRYTELIRHTRSNNPTVTYAVHILNKCHEYGLVDEIMKLPQPFIERI
jgi:hypothetical protein